MKKLAWYTGELYRGILVNGERIQVKLSRILTYTDRDIKPENLLFYPVPFVPSRKPKARAAGDEDKEDEGEFIKGVGAGGIGVIKIADFGLSKVIWDTQTMTPCGTVGYTAPEIVKDERYSKSVDMWALGCVLYTLLCGFPPFYDESIQTLTEKVAMGQYTFLSPWWDDISKSAQDLVSHLLTVDPDKRYDIKQFLNHPWIRESQEETSAAADAPPLATPMYTRHSQRESGFIPHDTKQQQPQQQNDYSSLDPPATGDGRKYDFRSPGVVNLREVFDVGYAVHRQEEEGKRRKNFGQGYRGGFAAAIGGGLNSLNEDMEEDDEYYDEDGNATGEKGEATAPVPAGGTDAGYHPSSKVPRNQGADVSSMEQKLRNTTLGATAQARQQPLTNPNTNTSTNPAGSAADRANQQQQQQPPQQGYGQHSAAVAAAARKHARAKGGPFELSLDNATLLGRRGKRNPDDEHDADHPRRGVMTAVR